MIKRFLFLLLFFVPSLCSAEVLVNATTRQDIIDDQSGVFRVYNAPVNYFDGEQYKKLEDIKTDLSFPEGKIIESQQKDGVIIFTVPEGLNGVLSDDKKEFWLTDKKGEIIKYYHTPTVLSVNEKIGDATSVMEDAEFGFDGANFRFVPRLDSEKQYPLMIFDDVANGLITADTYVEQIASTTNRGTSVSMAIGGQYAYRVFMRFNTNNLVDNASNYTIITTSLKLYRASASANTGGYQSQLFALTQPNWVETQATWNVYATGLNWTTPGGDFNSSTIIAQNNLQGGGAFWETWNFATTSLPNFNETQNYILKVSTEVVSNSATYYSRNQGYPYTPYLEISYQLSSQYQILEDSTMLENFTLRYQKVLIYVFGSFLALALLKIIIDLTAHIVGWYTRIVK